jgi:hypothetical protein
LPAFRWADGTLVGTPDLPSTDLIPSLLAASDVLGTGWFGAIAAEAGAGKTIGVVGDGAVGLLAVLAAAKHRSVERIIVIQACGAWRSSGPNVASLQNGSPSTGTGAGSYVGTAPSRDSFHHRCQSRRDEPASRHPLS